MGSTRDCIKQNKDLVDLMTNHLKLSSYRSKRKKKKVNRAQGIYETPLKRQIHKYGNLRIEERENEQKASANNGPKLPKFEGSQIQNARKPPTRITQEIYTEKHRQGVKSHR